MFKTLIYEHDGLWTDVYRAFFTGATESVSAIFVDSPQAGLSYLAENEVDFIVIDMDFPSFDAFDFLDAMKKEPLNSAKPFLIATDEFRDEYFFNKAYKTGAVDYIVKSEAMDRLYNRVKLVERLKTLYGGAA